MLFTGKVFFTSFRFSLLASRFSLLASIFFIFLLSSFVFAQVIIKEKVEINPQTIISENAIAHTIEVRLTWDTPSDRVVLSTYNLLCQPNLYSGWVYGGNIVLSINNVVGETYYLRAVLDSESYGLSNFTYEIYLDGTLVKNGSFALRREYYFPTTTFQYTPSLVTNYSVDIPSTYSCLFYDVSMKINYQNSCTASLSWNPYTEPINFSII